MAARDPVIPPRALEAIRLREMTNSAIIDIASRNAQNIRAAYLDRTDLLSRLEASNQMLGRLRDCGPQGFEQIHPELYEFLLIALE